PPGGYFHHAGLNSRLPGSAGNVSYRPIRKFQEGPGMFSKVLVANRGEIAIRAFRAGYELGAGTVAVFPHEDRNSLHRLKADEAYEIGVPGHPVRAYLSVDEIIRAARQAGADAVYPGYGFLSENPDLATAC